MRVVKPKFSAILFLLITFKMGYSQNMVLNPSFENTNSCPGGPGAFNQCVDWTTVNIGSSNCSSPDLYAGCASQISGVNSPNGILGIQPSRTGTHHAGVILLESAGFPAGCTPTGWDNYREYVGGRLASPLLAGQDYCVTIHVSLAGQSKWGANCIGIYLSDTIVTQDFCSNPTLSVTPQLQYVGSPIMDTLNWVQLQWNYTATGGEQFFTIGNFMDTANIVIANNNCGFIVQPIVYYFIDDVTIIPGACVPCPNITVSASSIVQPLCYGDSTGKINISASGGLTPYSYTWTPNISNTSSASGLPDNTYQITVADTNLCIGSTSVVIKSPSALNIAIAATNICDNSPGSAVANISGGTSPYSFSWSNGASTQSINNLTAGTYTVTITDFNNCSSTQTTTISQQSQLVINSSSTATICGDNNGVANISVSGGSSPYSYQWSNGQTTNNLTGLAPGTYYVTVSEGSASGNKFWSEDFSSGGTGWTLNLNGTGINGSTPNQWIINNDNGCGPCGSGGNYLHITCSSGFVCPGSGQCFYDPSFSSPFGDPATDKYVSSPDISTVGKTNIALNFWYVCGGEANADYGQVRLSNNGGSTWTDLPKKYFGVSSCTKDSINIPASYENISNFRIAFRWINDASNSGGGDPFSIDDIELYAASSGSSCPATDSIFIDTSVAVSANLTSFASICNQPNGTATIFPNTGVSPFSYIWSNTQNTQSATGLIAGNYSVTISDSTGCTTTYSVTISDSSTFPASNGSKETTVYFGEQVLLTASSGISYLWSTGETSNSIIVEPQTNTSYYVTFSDSFGCSSVDTFHIIVDKKFTIYVPNVFSPSSMNGNNILYVRGSGIKTLHFTIYNRWGEAIFDTGSDYPWSGDRSIGWDGTYKGTKMNSGVFVYSLTGIFLNNTPFSETGNITLIR
jgi:hypothetical protein